MDVHFEVVLRRSGTDTPIVAWDHHFDPLGAGNFDAQPLDADAEGVAVDYVAGDQIVFIYSGQSASSANAYIPDGDGARKNGRNPSITLP